MSEQHVVFSLTARFRRVCVHRHVDAVLTAGAVSGHVAADSQDGADAGQGCGVGHQNQRAGPP